MYVSQTVKQPPSESCQTLEYEGKDLGLSPIAVVSIADISSPTLMGYLPTSPGLVNFTGQLLRFCEDALQTTVGGVAMEASGALLMDFSDPEAPVLLQSLTEMEGLVVDNPTPFTVGILDMVEADQPDKWLVLYSADGIRASILSLELNAAGPGPDPELD